MDQNYFHYEMAKKFLELGDYEKEVEEYQKGAERAEREGKDWLAAYYYFCKGVAFQSEGRFENACNEYKKAIALYPSNPAFFYELGKVLRKMGRMDEAKVAFRDAEKIDPDFYRRSIIDDLSFEKKFEMALEECDKGIEDAKKREYPKKEDKISSIAYYHHIKGYVYWEKGDHENAIKEFSEAAKIQPGNYRHFMRKADILEEIHRIDEAIKEAEKTKELEKEYSSDRFCILTKLGSLYLKKSKIDKAVEMLKESLPEGIDSLPRGLNPSYAPTLAAELIEKGVVKEAIEYLKRLLKIEPNLKEAQYLLASAYEKDNLTKEAVIEWRKYLTLDKDSEQAAIAKDHLKKLEGETPTP
jgi:tetratricopeptide (TPR) repeat protein